TFDPNGLSPPWSPEPSPEPEAEIDNVENEESVEDQGQHLTCAESTETIICENEEIIVAGSEQVTIAGNEEGIQANEASVNAENQEIVEAEGQHLARAESEGTANWEREQGVDAENEQDQNAENAKAFEAENKESGATESQPSPRISEGCVATCSGFVPEGLWNNRRASRKLEERMDIYTMERILRDIEKDEDDDAENDPTESDDDDVIPWRTPGDEAANERLFDQLKNEPIEAEGQAEVERLPDGILRVFTRKDDNKLATEDNLHRLLEECVYKDLSDPQKAATVNCIRGGGRFLLFDEGGLGKSMVALATMSFFSDDYPLLIVTTPQSIEKWKT
ncbi:unnamed protein product, partial [Mesorhabditis spiculigera]